MFNISFPSNVTHDKKCFFSPNCVHVVQRESLKDTETKEEIRQLESQVSSLAASSDEHAITDTANYNVFFDGTTEQ